MLVQLKRNDDKQSLVYIIQNDDGSTPILTGATVQFVMGKKNKLVINSPAIIQSATDGIVAYEFNKTDTLIAGNYMAEFIVTFATGEQQTFPNRGYISVNIEANLDTNQTNIVVDMLAEKQGEFTKKLDSILLQAGNISMSTMNEYTWTSTTGQTTYVMPTNANYDSFGKWFEVYVGGIPVDPSLIDRSVPNKFTLLIESSLVPSGTTVHAKWTEPIIPVSVGHHLHHEENGADEIDITKLKGYKQNITNKIGSIVTPQMFGAVGNGIIDDTVAIQAAINYAQSLVTNRFLNGVTIFFPQGTYLVTSTLLITSSNITLCGESHSSSVLYAPSAIFDVVHFNGTTLSLYAVGMKNLRIYTPTNATTGRHLRTTKTINAFFENLYLVGWYDGIAVDGCGKTYFNNIILSQENRTSGKPRYGFDFLDGGGINSDVHLSNIQIVPSTVTSEDYTMSIRSADGIYFNNVHIHGGVLVQPNNVGFGDTLASLFFSNCYFDTANQSNFMFTGSATNYRNFFFDNCYFRDGKNGVQINTTLLINRIQFSNCHFSQQEFNGVECINSQVSEVTFNGCLFSDNNTVNNASYGDILTFGRNFIINGCSFKGGGALGYGVQLRSSTVNALISACTFSESTASKKFINAGSATKIGTLNGVNVKVKGSATILTGTTSIVVTHGVDLSITVENILLTPRTSLSGGVSYWFSNLTATQFTINVQTAPSANIIFTWIVDSSI